jgi:hypothetical protein
VGGWPFYVTSDNGPKQPFQSYHYFDRSGGLAWPPFNNGPYYDSDGPNHRQLELADPTLYWAPNEMTLIPDLLRAHLQPDHPVRQMGFDWERNNLIQHGQIGPNQYQCSLCGDKFHGSLGLNFHMNHLHRGELPNWNQLQQGAQWKPLLRPRL